MKKLLLIVLLTAALIAGCNSDSGTVIFKEYTSVYTKAGNEELYRVTAGTQCALLDRFVDDWDIELAKISCFGEVGYVAEVYVTILEE